MAVELGFRAMEERDVESIHRLEVEIFGKGWSPEVYRRELSQGQVSRYWVLEEGEALLGFCGFWLMGEEAHLNVIAISPAQRGRGLGRYLLYRAVAECRGAGVRWLTLEVRSDNQAAFKLYKKFGFARVGSRPAYYDDRMDAVIMWAGNLQSKIYGLRLDAIGEDCRCATS